MNAKDRDEMRRCFEFLDPPEENSGCILISGAAMNELFGAPLFPDHTMYVVTPDGITALESRTVH